MNAVSLRREGYVDIITLQRPPINALDMETLSELSEAVESAKTDREIRVLLIASGLDGIFCSGGDLKFWMGIADGRDVGDAGRRVFAQIESFPKPTIAVLNGHVIGDGLSLALACDLRVASETVSLPNAGSLLRVHPGLGFRQETYCCGRPCKCFRDAAHGKADHGGPGQDNRPRERNSPLRSTYEFFNGNRNPDRGLFSSFPAGNQMRPAGRG